MHCLTSVHDPDGRAVATSKVTDPLFSFHPSLPCPRHGRLCATGQIEILEAAERYLESEMERVATENGFDLDGEEDEEEEE